MSGGSRLGRQLEQVVGAFTEAGLPFALIGGLALAPHGVVRATQDIDLLVDSSQADPADRVLIRLGDRCIFRSGDAANYQRDDERVEMNSSKSTSEREQPSAAEQIAGGAHGPQTLEGALDPFAQRDDLMMVVEALCPRWPSRDAMRISGPGLLL